jgi:hypothetical protein
MLSLEFMTQLVRVDGSWKQSISLMAQEIHASFGIMAQSVQHGGIDGFTDHDGHRAVHPAAKFADQQAKAQTSVQMASDME